MNSFTPRAVRAAVSTSHLYVDLTTGVQIVAPLAAYPRLDGADTQKLGNWRLIGGGEGIHWPDLDEDISVRGLLVDVPLESVKSAHLLEEEIVQTKTAFEPAPVPTGIEVIGGHEYMRDGRGALMSVDAIKPADKLQDEMVRKVIGFALGLSGQVARFKEHAFGDVVAFDQLLEQQYGVVRPGNMPSGKGNRTYLSYDGLLMVTVQVSDTINFGPELQIGKALLDECMIEWSADARPEIRSIIQRAFNTEKEGQVSRSDIFMLLRIESEDKRWVQAMEAIRAAMRVVSRKEYIRFGMRDSAKAKWTSITIDLSQA